MIGNIKNEKMSGIYEKDVTAKASGRCDICATCPTCSYNVYPVDFEETGYTSYCTRCRKD